MKYYVRNSDGSTVTGPYSAEEIEARLKAGELSADALATEDTGDSPANVTGWLCVHQLPGVGGNPAMRGLGPPPLPTSPNPIRSSSGFVGLGAICCPKCSAPMTAGETLCHKCAEHTARAEKKSAGPSSLIVLFIQVPGGFFIHLISFIFVCAMCFMLGGGYKSSSGTLVFGAVIHCIAWIAFAIRLIRNQAERGVGFGIFIGVGLAALLTANCNMGK